MLFNQIKFADNAANPTPFDLWTYQFATIIITTIIIVTGILIYYFKQRNLKVNQAPSGFVLIVELFVKTVRTMVDDMFGKKYRWMTPYFIYLFMYIGVGAMLSFIGLDPPVTSLTVAASLGLVTWIVTFIFTIKYQKWFFLNKMIMKFPISVKGKKYKIPYLINPLEIIGLFPPLISISMRLWGNIMAGGIVLTFIIFFTGKIPYIHYFNIVGGLLGVPFHIYFDALDGIIQTMVFGLLTMVYWSNAMHEGIEHYEHVSESQHTKKTIASEIHDVIKEKIVSRDEIAAQAA